VGSSPNQFQLQRGRWYAAQLLGSEFEPDAGHAYSPIKILDVRPLKTGQGLLEVTFHHENYPEGVQSKRYQLRMIAHDSTFVFALRLARAVMTATC